MIILATGAFGVSAPQSSRTLMTKSHNQEFELYYGMVIIFYIFSMLSMRATHRTGIDWNVSMYMKSQFMLRPI